MKDDHIFKRNDHHFLISMPLYTSVPINDPNLHDQKEAKEVSQEELKHYITPYPITSSLRFMRFVCFIVFLGPFRLISCIISLILFFITVSVLGTIGKLPFIKDKRKYKNWASKITYISERLCLLSVGIVYISLNGEIKPETRTIVSNHLTMVDPVSLLSQIPVSYLVMSGLKGNPFFSQTSKIYDIIYVDRSKKEGITQQVCDFQNNPNILPLTIFPEGKVTNGECVLGFRSGGFVNNTPVQPVTLRYKLWFCPRDMATISWVSDDTLEYIYQLFSIPFITLEVNILDPIKWEKPDMTPQEKANQAELIIANSLGCLALKNTNKEIFQKHLMNEKKDGNEQAKEKAD